MNEVTRIREQLRRAYEAGAWHGPSVKEVLAGVSAAQAARRPLPQAHSIWEIVLHIESWTRAARASLEGAPMPALPFPDDWPAVAATTEADWQAALGRLDRTHRSLLDALQDLPEERLRETVPGRTYDFYVLLHGIAQHDIYHAGQMALLKKA